MGKIRKATAGDIPRLAEILVFSKRVNYRHIFNDDYVSFNVITVYSQMQEYVNNPALLDTIYVYEDGFVKGMVNIQGDEIKELYADSFFTGQGIGRQLIAFAIQQGAQRLWCLEKNTRAIKFYNSMGFVPNGRRKYEAGSTEYIVELVR